MSRKRSSPARDSWALRAMQGSFVQSHLAHARDDTLLLTPLVASPLDAGSFGTDVAVSYQCCVSQSCCQSQSACPGVAESESDRRLGAGRSGAGRLWPVALS